MEKQKVFMNKEEYNKKIEYLNLMGVDPDRLKKYNIGLFNALVVKMQMGAPVPDMITSFPFDSDRLWWSQGNKELAKKYAKEEDPAEQTEDDVKRLLDKMKKPSGKKSIRGKRKK